ncbi:protein YAE1 homolog [Equus asinus]|uniref:YAE1 maturation factor of ABCE1 n=1 Tax=Equus asinus TaxID=9793 RepID=A0A8C4PRQ4_EQUAS
MRKRTRSRPVSPDSHSPPRPWDRMELPALPAAGGCVVASVMSWVRASPLVRDPGEDGDVFDEEADESLVVQREWRSHMQRRVKEGYRDGIDAGKAVTLQQGFNQGYKEGAEVIINYGQLRGTLSALLSWCHLHDNSSALISKINNLLDAVGQCEEYVLKHLKSITPQPHVVDLLDSLQDMDLCHVVPAEKKTDEATDERLCENNAEFNKNCGRSVNGVDGSSLECCRTQEHAHSEQPSLTWILEQTASLVEQLGVSIDVLQHLKQL